MGNKKRDFTEDILKNKRIKEIFSRILFGRLVLTFLILFIQVAVLFVFMKWLEPYIGYYFGGSITLSFLFMIYLANSDGRNEFKLAWLLPLIIFPLFGVIAYTLYHIDMGGYKFKKRIAYLKKQTDEFLPEPSESAKIISAYPEIRDLAVYLLDTGHYAPHTNSSVRYFSCGEEFFPDFLAELEKARKFIFIEYFIIKLDESWLRTVRILEKKAAEGVEIRVLFDAIGSVTAASANYVKYLNEHGINAQIFSPITALFSIHYNNRDHRKIVIIDGETAYTGGLNIANEYFNFGKNKFRYWKDTAVKVQGPAIQNFTCMFMHTWNLDQKKDDDYGKYIKLDYPKKESRSLLIPYGDNAFNNEDIAENIYSYMINTAKKYVHITSPYLVIDNKLLSELIFAAKRGVDVSVIVPSMPDHLMTFCIGKTFLKQLVENGVSVYLYKKECFIHAKNFIADGKTATIGSVNLDYRSLYHHFECGLLIHDDNVINKIEHDFQDTIGDCTKMDIHSYKMLPWHIRTIGKLCRIFAPLV